MTCGIDGCTRKVAFREMCRACYDEFRKANPEQVRKYQSREGTCSVVGCGRPIKSTRLCSMHAGRKRKTGNVGSVGPTVLVGVPPEQRFWAHVQEAPAEECWLWRGGYANGYGKFGAGQSRIATAHRYAYELLICEIPDGLQLDHLCRNPPCVNPWHLDPVTPLVNTRRSTAGEKTGAKQRAKTHCPQGHPYDNENTIVKKGGVRACRRCSRAAWRTYARRKRAEKKASEAA